MNLLKRFASSRIARLLVVAGGSWRFWAASALAATTTAVATAVVYSFLYDNSADGSYPYQCLVSQEGKSSTSNPNPSARILLMNSDRSTTCFVDCDNFTGSTTGTKTNRDWWEFMNDDAVGTLTGSYASLVKGTWFRLHAKGNDGEVLWEAFSCRGGNLNKKTDAKVNQLPFSTSAQRYNNRNYKAAAATSGTLVMQNVQGARVVSSCFDDGIGTVYFDAVNGFTGYTGGQLQVQVAYGVFRTNETGSVMSPKTPAELAALTSEELDEVLELEKDEFGRDVPGAFAPPDAAHCDEVTEVSGELTTNAYGRCAWLAVNLSGVYFQGSKTAYENVGTNSVAELKCTQGGKNTYFYRFWAPVQDPAVNPLLADHCRGPLRFQIIRLDDPTSNPDLNGSTLGDDGEGGNGTGLGSAKYHLNGLLVLDNIIASFPAMCATATPQGEYVAGGSSRNVIGWSGVLSSAYPRTGETGLAATARYDLFTNAPPVEIDSGWAAKSTATFNYRWRYIGLTNDWQSIAMAQTSADGTNVSWTSAAELAMAQDPGDVEFYYATEIDAPYYKYLDYSGGDYGTPGYSERVTRVESRLDKSAIPATGLPSTGEDFFFRLREGTSDQLEFRLQVRSTAGKAAFTNETPFHVTADRTWKAYLKTTTNETADASQKLLALPKGSYEFRVVGANPACTYGGNEVTTIPWSGKRLFRDSSNAAGWTKFTVDSITGALMFQLMENETTTGGDAAADGGETAPASSAVADEMTLTLVHADYQDFNYWSDAASAATPPLYVGAFSDTKGRQSGSSPDTREFACEITNWTATATSNATYWTEAFSLTTQQNPEDGYNDYAAFETFARCYTPNGWLALNSQWVPSQYRTSKAGGDLALQLGSVGSGSISYVNSKQRPHGVDAFAVKARLAQSQKFDDFAYYSGAAIEDMTGYMFSARVAMATNAAAAKFEGCGTVSLVGYYQPGEGCYEVRAERIASNQVRLSLYKWSFDEETNEVKATFLGRSNWQPYFTSQSNLQTRGSYYAALFIRCYAGATAGTTVVEAGMLGNDKTLPRATESNLSGAIHYVIRYTDTTDPYEFGTFGVGSANCPAQIIQARYYATPTNFKLPTCTTTCFDLKGNKLKGKDVAGVNAMTCGSGAVTYPANDLFEHEFEVLSNAYRYRNWISKKSRFVCSTVGGYPALSAVAPTGQLELFAGEDESSMKSMAKADISGFLYTNVTFSIRNTADSLVRLATSAKTTADVVVDDLSFTQWTSASYGDSDNDAFIDATKLTTQGCPNIYVYQNGWVTVETAVTTEGVKTNHTVTLAPARVRANSKGVRMATIRSPLMDGGTKATSAGGGTRGIGLGMMNFTYKNADSNCVVNVQYAKCENTASLYDITEKNDAWVTVATYDFSKMTAAERAGGTISTYVGEHGVKGVMRIALDDQLVADAQDESKNPGKAPGYGSIDIVDFLSRDEPAIDDRCWWGWNLRTTDAATERSLYDSKPSEGGLALALNNSVTADVEAETADLYPQHLPFVQTPTFATNLVGEVSFRARRLPGETGATEVAIFGAKDGGVTEETAWEWLETVVVTNDAYRQFSYRTKQDGDKYAAFRLAVIGVSGLNDEVPSWSEKMDALVAAPRRVLIDEVAVSEAVRGKLAFRDVGAFRGNLSAKTAIQNVTDKSNQPMVNESWGVQGEVYVAQMEEEIDATKGFEVTFHWFRGTEPWGYENWKGLSGAKSAKLGRAEGTSAWIYRSSYDGSPEAVVLPTTTNEVVQYVLEVEYYTAAGVLSTNRLSAADWTKPSWYHPIDFNAGKGDDAFAAYTILDTVAPGWAWINEVNVFGGYDQDLDNVDLTRQYVEVAAPAEADLTGWTLKFLDRDSSEAVTTNVVAKFGSNVGAGLVPATKTKNVASNCVFFALASSKTRKAKTLSEADGEVDGYWVGLTARQAIGGDDVIGEKYPLGIQLVRPSGVIEHEIVVAGTNVVSRWGAALRDPQEHVKAFNAMENGGAFFFAGYDQGGASCSLGVLANAGATSNDWSNAMAWTPGKINAGQQIDPTHPTPFGDSVVVYLNIGKFMQQTVDGETSRDGLVQVVRKGDADGIVVDYRTDPWYVLGSVTTNDAATSFATTGARTYRLTVGQNCSNDMITVYAESALKPDLEKKYGLTEDNEYRDAVMDWLRNGKDLYGNDWKSSAEDDVLLAEYQNKAGVTITNMTLTSMYWLDIPPTEGNWILRGDLLDFAPEVIDSNGKTNVRVQVYMMISNKLEQTSWETSEPHRQAHAPYVLRGFDPGSSSQDYRAGYVLSPAWTSVTFKITSNVNIARDKRTWMPLKPFVFDKNSFNARGDADEFQATIDVRHPASPASPGYTDVQLWKAAHPGEALPSFFFYWTIDDRQAPVTVETLKADNTFK